MAVKSKYYSNYKNDSRKWKARSRSDDRSKKISYVLMFFIATVLVFAVLFNCALVSFLNNSKISEALADERIVSMVKEKSAVKFREAFKDYDVSENLVNSVLNDKAIRSDLDSLVISGQMGFNANIYSKEFVIADKVEDFLVAKGQKVSKAEKEKLQSISAKFLDDFSRIINFRFWGYYAKIKNIISYYSLYIEIALLATIAILVTMLFRQKRKYTHRFFRYSCEALWSACVALGILYFAFKAVGVGVHYDFTSGEIFEIFINNLFVTYCTILLDFTAFLFILGIICFVTSHFMRENFIKQYKHQSHTKGSEEYHKEIIDFLEDGKYEGGDEKISMNEPEKPDSGSDEE